MAWYSCSKMASVCTYMYMYVTVKTNTQFIKCIRGCVVERGCLIRASSTWHMAYTTSCLFVIIDMHVHAYVEDGIGLFT